MKGRINPDFLPPAGGKILLHSCCAPCSAAVMEELLRMGADFAVFYFNPNIFPLQEYELRKSENKKLALSMGAPFIDADWTHSEWSAQCSPLAAEPERGARCLECFKLRLLKTAEYASANGFSVFSTTLTSSRWKSAEQVAEAGAFAESAFPDVRFWLRNWRKGGLSERRAQLLREYGFYNQTYCGCEYSMPPQSCPQNNSAESAQK
ncbi:epoxyqueuosine reductase QueH [Opitutia bacterium KCR 482]|nr:epoxyqueuosine reductase QueH [Opitutae bacterium KCR 482]